MPAMWDGNSTETEVIMKRKMIFENGRVVVRGGGQIPTIEPISKELSAEEVQQLFERHGFSQGNKSKYPVDPTEYEE